MWLFRIREARVVRTDELGSSRVCVDYDAQGTVLGVWVPGPPLTTPAGSSPPASVAPSGTASTPPSTE
jgi:hypothetical protein